MLSLYEYSIGIIVVLAILLIFIYLSINKPNHVICNEKVVEGLDVTEQSPERKVEGLVTEHSPERKVEGFYPVTNQAFMLEQINDDVEKNILPPYTYRQSTVAMALGDLEFGRDWVATTPSQYKNKFRSSKARNSLIRKATQKADKADIWDPTN